MTQGAEIITGAEGTGSLMLEEVRQLGQRIVAELAQLDIVELLSRLSPEQVALLRHASDLLMRAADHADILASGKVVADTIPLHGIPAQREEDESDQQQEIDVTVEAEDDETVVARSAITEGTGTGTPECTEECDERALPPVSMTKILSYARQKGWFRMEDLRRDVPEIAALSQADYEVFKSKFGRLQDSIIEELEASGDVKGSWQQEGRNRGKKYLLVEADSETLEEPALDLQQLASTDAVEPKEPGNQKSTKTDVSEPETELVEPGFVDEMEALVAPYWDEDDLSGLLDLLDNQINQGDETARFHLRQLLACFAPHRGDGEALDRVEWETINYLAGYKFEQQGLKPLSWSMLSVRMHRSYEKAGKTQEQVFAGALHKLLRLAAPEYQSGWYPKVQAEPAKVEVVPEPVEVAPVRIEQTEDERPRQLLEKLVRQSRLTPLHVEPLEAHLTGNRDTKPEEGRILQQGLAVLGQLLREAEIKGRGSFYHSSGRQKGSLTTTETRVMSWLIGNNQAGLAPEPFTRLIKSEKVRQLGIDTETLPNVVRKALDKITKD